MKSYKSLIGIIVILLFIVGCSQTSPSLTTTPESVVVRQSNQTLSIPPATSTPPSISPAIIITIANPFNLSALQISQLGKTIEQFVDKRQVVIQRFDRGVMLTFAGTGNVFGGGFIFALANDGRAWRIKDTFIETSKNSDDWYTCERRPGLRPERSGIPWRGFGKAWCNNPSVRDALGFAKIYEDVDDGASYQSFERGYVFALGDWKGYPNWKNGQAYTIYYAATTNPDLVTGKWE